MIIYLYILFFIKNKIPKNENNKIIGDNITEISLKIPLIKPKYPIIENSY